MTYNKQKQTNGWNKNIIKSGILNLTQFPLNIPTTDLLNLVPNFSLSFKKLPYMEILTPIESFVLRFRKIFLYKNEIRSIPSSGPIGLSLMVVIAEAFF